MQVLKYELPEDFGVFYLELPKGAEVLSVANQFDIGQLWAAVDPEAHKVRRKFEAVNTGGEAPKGGKFIGSFQRLGGRHVHHIFEVA